MKEVWRTKTLASVCETFTDGDWVETKDQSSSGIRLIQTGNVGEGVFKDRPERARFVSEATFKRLRCTEIFEGDCLISRLPDPVGRSCLLPNTGVRMITAVDCTIVRFKLDEVFPEFFNLYAQSNDYLNAVDAETTGTTRKRISRTKLGQIAIPLPSLAEQQRIIGILDEAFESIATAAANAQKNLENARALFESHVQSVFSRCRAEWADRKLDDVCEKITDGAHHSPKTKFPAGGPGRFLYITSKNIRNNYLDLSDVSYVDEDFHSETYRSCQPRVGDVLLTKDGANTGNVTLNTIDEPFSLLSSVCLIKTDRASLLPGFLCFYIQSSTGLQSIVGQMTGAAIKRIVLRDIKQARVPVPPIADQKRIVDTLNSLLVETRRLATQYERKLAAVEALRQSLLHQAFTGQLVARAA